MGEVLVDFIDREDLVATPHAEPLLQSPDGEEFFLLVEFYGGHEGVPLNDKDLVLVGEDEEQRVLDLGRVLPGQVVKPVFFLYLQRNQLLLFLQQALLRVQFPKSDVILPHQNYRFLLQRVD